jgi:excisionase family DNA binding protein
MSDPNGTGHSAGAAREPAMDLVTLLRSDPATVATVPAEHLPTLLVAMASLQSQLAAVSNALSARLLADAAAGSGTHPATSAPSEQGALTQEAAAEAYGLPLRTLRRLTRTGRVPSYRLGRNRMLRAADLDCYLALCRVQSVKVGTILDV